MSLYVNDRVLISSKNKTELPSQHGVVVDLKWNLVLIKFDTGEHEWIDNKSVRKIK